MVLVILQAPTLGVQHAQSSLMGLESEACDMIRNST